MDGIDAVTERAAAMAADQLQACSAFFTDIDMLCDQANEYLAELSKHADEADRQKLRTAALKMRLHALAKERRSREAAAAAIIEAKQRELDRLLQEEQALSQQQQPSMAQRDPGQQTATTLPFSASRTT